ncbi:MAG TPA: phage terminase large subunit family protein, partial [Woeseiaceae bacterium]|nr:phage terminase large subunit family protein [Woeseiaceae bacterium]
KWKEANLPPEQAVYQCVHCGELITEGQRQQMLVSEIKVVPTKEFNGIAGFHVNELMSPFVTLGEMAVSFIEANKLPETLQSWINTSLGETWEDAATVVEPEGLLVRREPYDVETIPADVCLLTIGVDTQDDRIELQLLGWGADEECWVIEHVVFRGNPGAKVIWNELTKYRMQRFVTEDGRTLLIQGTGIDSGGHYTQQVYDYCYRYRFQRVFAVKGRGGVGQLAWPRRPGKTKLSKADVYSVGVDTIKDILYGRIAKVAKPGPGYIHLPASVDQEWCDQLLSEKKIYRRTNGRKVATWRPRKIGMRQEAQDCWNYGYAVMRGRNVNLNKLFARIQKRRAADVEEAEFQERPVNKKRKKAKATKAEAKPEVAPKKKTAKKKRRRRAVRSNYLNK